MELMQLNASYLLLFHVICPFVCGLLLFSNSSKPYRRGANSLTIGLHLLLVTTSLGLLILMLGRLVQTGAPVPIRLDIPISLSLFTISSGSGTSPELMSRLVWGIDLESAIFLCLLPWLSLTAELFTTTAQRSLNRTAANLLLLGSLSLFVVGWDLGTLLCGGLVTILLIALLVVQHGGEGKRVSTNIFLTIQICGLLLLASSLGMFVASAGIVPSAPIDLPGKSSTVLPEVADRIQTAVATHPASSRLWDEYRLLPSGLMLCSLLIMAAGFPIQVWLSEVSESAALGERLWLVVWVKAVLFIGLRLLNTLDPEALQTFGWWGLMISILGAIFVASLILSQAYLPRIQSSGLAWTQQMALIAAFCAAHSLNSWLVPLLICQTAGLVLFSVALTLISERYQSVEIASFRGLAQRAGWLLPVLLICLLTLTLTPFSLGLTESWLVSATLQNGEDHWGSLLRLIYLLADLLALAGLARVTQQLCTGPLRLPEMSPGLRERAQLPPPTTTLNLSGSQLCLLAVWGALAIAAASSPPVLRIFNGLPV